MKEQTTEELQKRIERLVFHNEKLLSELSDQFKIVEVLVAAGHLNKDKLEQATAIVNDF